jgi:hypothetical protein
MVTALQVHDTKPPFLEGFVVDMSKQVRSAPGRCEDRCNMLQPIAAAKIVAICCNP